jgi:hypothetical protein
MSLTPSPPAASPSVSSFALAEVAPATAAAAEKDVASFSASLAGGGGGGGGEAAGVCSVGSTRAFVFGVCSFYFTAPITHWPGRLA